VKAACALLAAVLACGGGAGDAGEPSTVAYGDTFHLAIGERALVGGEFQVTFARVAEESRCPSGARCPEAGNAATAFGVASETGSATLTLNTGREPRSAAAAGHELHLIALEPLPRAGAATDSAEYAATLIVRPVP
jgi:hypothetical protein